MKDLLIKNIDIITNIGVIKNGCIVIDNGKFDYVGEQKEEVIKAGYTRLMDGKNKIAAPGLVNAHTHSPMVLLRNYANDFPLHKWLFDYIIPAENQLSEQDIYWGTLLAITEMIQSGTTAFLDMYLHMDEVAKAVVETGIKACLSKDVIKSHVRNNETIIDKESFKEFYNKWHNCDNRIKVNTEIHSVFLYDEKSLESAADVAKDFNTSIHIHILEGTGEKKMSMDIHGKGPFEVCKQCGILDVPVVAAHCVHLDKKDFDIIKTNSIIPVHNPSSNMILGSGIAPVPEMMEKDILIALGTDGAASNNNLNMFEEMHLASLIHKGIHMNPEFMSARDVLKMATKNGAKALGFKNTGEIAEGKDADLILINIDKPHIHPLRNHIAAMVYSIQGSDVDTTIVNGKILMENRELKTIDIEKVMAHIRYIEE